MLSGVLNAQKNRLEFSVSYFNSSDQVFRDIYGGGIQFGLDLGRRLGKKLELHFEARYFEKKGHLTLTKERTSVWLKPIGLSLNYVFVQGKLNVYAGGGLALNAFREKNPIGEAKQSKVGFKLKAGAFSRINGFKKILKAFIIGIHINYLYCEMKPVKIKFDSGGLDFGWSFGVEF